MELSTLDLSVERPVAGGLMLARHEGRVVLVGGAIPGERVRARVDRERHDVIFATVVDVLDPDPDRRSVEGDPMCGGQAYRHIAYERQRQLKTEVISDALRRIASLPGLDSIPVAPSPERGYRMRARFHVGPSGLGFLREGTHIVCDAAQTEQLLDETHEVVANVGQRLVRSRDRSVAHVDLAESIDADERVLHFFLRQDRSPRTVAGWAEDSGVTGVTHSRRGRTKVQVAFGVPTVTDRVSVLTQRTGTDCELRRHARSFFQGNRYLLPALVTAVCHRVSAAGPVVDLYAGVGLFAVALAYQGRDGVTAVEGDSAAVADLRSNTTGLQPRVSVVGTSVEKYLALRSDAVEGTVIVDPPRTGLSKTVVEQLLQRRVPHLVYVACDVATFARDLRRFADAGYSVEGIEAFDMFPNTPHVELLATLRS